MTESPVSEEKLADLAQIYGWLKRDAKDMLQDLLRGVDLWRSTARILFIFALTSALIGSVFVWGSYASQGTGALSIFLGLLAIFLYSITIVTTLTGISYRDKYLILRTKYSQLYDSARKLS